MTRKKHDQYSKQFVAELLEPQGEIKVNYEIPPGEAHYTDLYFKPFATANFQTLGLLGKIAVHHCLLEPFRNPPTKIEIQTCLQKLFTLRSELLNEQERYKKSLSEEEKKKVKAIPEEELPRLWILATSASDNSLKSLGVAPKQGWCEGVYFLPETIRTAIISINRLPKTPETLLLRLLGKGATQKQAIEEIRALSEDNALRNHVEGLLYRWHICVESQNELIPDDKEILMNLSEIVKERQEKLRQQGLQQGMQQIVENLLRFRFGKIDEALSQAIKRLLNLPPDESSRLILQSSREELLAKLS